MKTSKELIDLIDKTLNGEFGESHCGSITLPDGRECKTDVGYVEEFWKDFKNFLNSSDWYLNKEEQRYGSSFYVGNANEG